MKTELISNNCQLNMCARKQMPVLIVLLPGTIAYLWMNFCLGGTLSLVVYPTRKVTKGSNIFELVQKHCRKHVRDSIEKVWSDRRAALQSDNTLNCDGAYVN